MGWHFVVSIERYLARRRCRLGWGSDSSEPDCEEELLEQADFSSSPCDLFRFFRLLRLLEGEDVVDDADEFVRNKRLQNCRAGIKTISLFEEDDDSESLVSMLSFLIVEVQSFCSRFLLFRLLISYRTLYFIETIRLMRLTVMEKTWRTSPCYSRRARRRMEGLTKKTKRANFVTLVHRKRSFLLFYLQSRLLIVRVSDLLSFSRPRPLRDLSDVLVCPRNRI